MKTVNIDSMWIVQNDVKIGKLVEGAGSEIQRHNDWGISREWTEQDQLGKCSTGYLWELDQGSDGKKVLWKV
jgi:hypothetical protein